MKQNLPSAEKANVISHALGILFGLIALPLLMFKSTNIWWGVYAFSFGFMFVFVASTVYHLMTSKIAKRRGQIIDHISIYFLIAGTYTPFILAFFEAQKGQLILQFLWGCVIVGSIFKVFFIDRLKIFSTIIYLAMSWAAIFFIDDFTKNMPTTIIIWLGIGGASYTMGTAFYLWEKLTYHHAIWHFFVLAGSISHWYAIWLLLG